MCLCVRLYIVRCTWSFSTIALWIFGLIGVQHGWQWIGISSDSMVFKTPLNILNESPLKNISNWFELSLVRINSYFIVKLSYWKIRWTNIFRCITESILRFKYFAIERLWFEKWPPNTIGYEYGIQWDFQQNEIFPLAIEYCAHVWSLMQNDWFYICRLMKLR